MLYLGKLQRLTSTSYGECNSFRYRKVFVAWKKWIRASKMEAARVHLLLEGFFSHASLYNAVNEVRAQLRRLDDCQLEWDFRGRSLTIAQFAAANVRRACRTVLMI